MISTSAWSVETRPRFAEAAPGGDSLEEPPELLLENDHHGQKDDGEKSLEHRRREVELERAGQVVDDAEDTDPHEDKPRGGIPEPDQQSVDHEGDQKDVEKILDAEAVKKDCNVHRYLRARFFFIEQKPCADSPCKQRALNRGKCPVRP
jgi:hypothetical protein